MRQHNINDFPPKEIRDDGTELMISIEVLAVSYYQRLRFSIARYYYDTGYWEGIWSKEPLAWWYLPTYAGENKE